MTREAEEAGVLPLVGKEHSTLFPDSSELPRPPASPLDQCISPFL